MSQPQRVMTVEQFREAVKGGARASMPSAALRSKYGAVRMHYQGHTFDSKAELQFQMHLELLRRLGKVAWWTRQIPFHLPATDGKRGKIYRADFGVQLPAGTFRIIDIKGRDTQTSAVKRAWVQTHFGVSVEVIASKSSGGYTWGL